MKTNTAIYLKQKCFAATYFANVFCGLFLRHSSFDGGEQIYNLLKLCQMCKILNKINCLKASESLFHN